MPMQSGEDMAEGLLALIDAIRQLDRKLNSINEEVNGPLLKLIEKNGRHVDEQEKWEGK